MSIEGACLCGGVRYALDGPLQSMTHCHCSMCRKHSGAAFMTFVTSPLGSLRWTAGEDLIRRYRASEAGDRCFCGVCGSSLPDEFQAWGIVAAPAASLKGELGLWPQSHMFVASKASWYEITDRLPQYPAYRPSVDLPDLERPEVAAEPGLVLGSCLCGAIAYEADADRMIQARNCHCTRFRHQTAAAHASNLFAPLGALRFRRGEALRVIWKLPEAERFATGFCGQCGGIVPRPIEKLGRYLIPMGSLDTDSGVRPSSHIFVADKAPWFEITDGLPQYEGYPPAS